MRLIEEPDSLQLWEYVRLKKGGPSLRHAQMQKSADDIRFAP